MKRFLPALALCVAFSACQVQKKDFTIHTTPAGATIAINGKKYEGLETPMTISIEEDKDLGITAMKPGYEVATKTVETETNWWRALLWNKSDPRARYIAVDEVTIPLEKIPSVGGYSPGSLPGYQPPPETIENSEVPALREMPSF